MTADGARGQLLRFTMEGERVRKASSVLEQESVQLASALRRAVPFLARRGTPVTLSYARAAPFADLVRDLPAPLHATSFVATPTRANGTLILDRAAIALILDGVLGGDGSSVPALDSEGLTTPQAALVARVADGILRAFSDVLVARIGVRLEPRASGADDAGSESAPIACALELGEGGAAGRVLLLLDREALLRASDEQGAESVAFDPRVASALEHVELELVAELGRIRMKLADVASLRAGDTLRVHLPVSGPVTVRACGQVVLSGRPTTSSGQIAVRVERHGR